MSPGFDISTLNPQQREAVEAPAGPVKILAGAGSGKTRAVTCRIARLVSDGAAPYRILAVTFTNKAAKEMRERVEEMIGDTARHLWLGTFHSVCSRLLRMRGEAIGVKKSFVVYDDSDQMTLVKRLLKKKDLDDKVFQPRAVLAEISRAKEKLQGPIEYGKQTAGYFESVVGDIYPEYQKALNAAGALDFDDILMKAVKLLQESKEVREEFQERFEHVLVDEYQDVNHAQYQLAKTLAEKHRSITIVGDDDQSIYAWRGADITHIMSFSKDWPDAKVISLTQNYRSTKTILKAANEIIKHNRGRSEKELWTENESGDKISVSESGTEHDEAMLVADTITRERRAGRRKYGDIAVLCRTNSQSRVLEEAFLAMRIPHVLIGGQRFYDRKEIKDLIAYMRICLNPNDGLSLRRVMNVPARGIGATTIGKIDAHAEENDRTLWESFADPVLQQSLSKRHQSAFIKFIGLIEDGQKIAAEQGITALLKHLMNRSGYLEELRTDRSEESVSRLENLQELINVTTEYEASEEEPTLEGFLEATALVSDVDSLTEEGEAVTLMTLHSSKGLEFPVVFMVGMEEGIFPHSRSLGSDTELEEERRLCYVGMTRAREQLHLLHARRRSMFGQPNFYPRSRFIDDLPADLLVALPGSSAGAPSGRTSVRQERSGRNTVYQPRKRQEEEIEVERLEDNEEAIVMGGGPSWTPPFKVGEQVQHRKFGIGVVVACAPLKSDAEVTVAFPGASGVKKMVQSLAKLEKV
jgi:DNA helicase-2/ATP-dependent DNA helicase PcrA